VEAVDGRLKEGQLICERCDRIVAVIGQFKFNFHLEGEIAPADADTRIVHSTMERRIPGNSKELSYSSRWREAGSHYMYTPGHFGDSCSFIGEFTDALVRLRHEPGGGIVDIFVDNSYVDSVDLGTPEGAYTTATTAATDLAAVEHRLVIATRGGALEVGRGSAALLEELVLYGPGELEGFHPSTPINYGNPYSSFIESYIDKADASNLILEIGGGDRRRCQDNHLNFEYLPFELADVYGDIHSVPFQDDTFDIVHSQAVFEHVADPQAAASELIRITKPGGLILTEVAFLQPLHAVPFHFFNMTLWGVEELFKSCELLASDWFGALSETVAWLLDAANIRGRISADRLEFIRAEFESFDGLMSHDDLKPVASGVHIAVRKPR
jgi:SAM-dependent methyltransferase